MCLYHEPSWQQFSQTFDLEMLVVGLKIQPFLQVLVLANFSIVQLWSKTAPPSPIKGHSHMTSATKGGRGLEREGESGNCQ